MSKFNSKSFNPQAFGAYLSKVPQLKKNELVRSKVLRGNSEIKNAFGPQTGTAYAVLPMYGLLDGEVQNYDGTTDFVPAVTNTFERGVVVVGRMKSWIESDFAEDITGGAGFMDNVASQVSEYLEAVDQNTLLSILEGLFSMTGAENLKFVNDHTLDVTSVDDGMVAPDTLNKAVQKACGDNKNAFSVAIMHSAVATNLENLNLLAYLKQTDKFGIQRDLTLATWNGRVVLIDDSMPTNTVGTGASAYTAYTTYLLGNGAFDYEDVGVKVPVEMSRDPKTKGGQDSLFVRQRKCFAPYGISYTKKSQASLSPTDAELKNGGNWEIVNDGGATKTYISHKAIPIARVISKG